MNDREKKLSEAMELISHAPGMETFVALFAIPDLIFDQMYLELRKELLSQFEREDVIEEINTFRQSEDYEVAVIEIQKLIAEVDEIQDMSKNKKELLKTLFGIFLDNSDANIKVQILKGGQIPTYANLNDAGADIYAATDVLVPPHTRGLIVPTGLKVAIPDGWMLSVRPRSGLSKKTGIRVSNAPGTIDAGYRDEIAVLVDNISNDPYVIKQGDRIAQLILEKVYTIKWTVVEDVSNIGNNRGGGLGSSGK